MDRYDLHGAKWCVHNSNMYVHPFIFKCPLPKNVHEYNIMREALLLLTKVTELLAALKLLLQQ